MDLNSRYLHYKRVAFTVHLINISKSKLVQFEVNISSVYLKKQLFTNVNMLGAEFKFTNYLNGIRDRIMLKKGHNFNMLRGGTKLLDLEQVHYSLF